MKRPLYSVMGSLLAVCILAGAKPAHKLEKTKGLPDGLSKKVAAGLAETGYRISGPKGAVVDVWFVQSASVKEGFQPTLMVKYPFKPGQLIGAMRIAKGQTYTDFRGQELKPGVYTLRYGQQPQDGNHIGTSALSDFFLALPAKMDTDPKTINVTNTLHQQSAKAAGSTHPAIFSLLPAEKADQPKLTHDEDDDFWILNLSITGSDKKSIPLRMVVIGKSEA